MRISTILDSLIDGKRRQMVKQIDEFDNVDFWPEFERYLSEMMTDKEALKYFADAAKSYARIKGW